jgi:hypothetical protein
VGRWGPEIKGSWNYCKLKRSPILDLEINELQVTSMNIGTGADLILGCNYKVNERRAHMAS